MRRLWISASSLILAVVAAPARADVEAARPAVRDDGGDFWREVLDPHGVEIDDIVEKARQALKTADEALQSGFEWAVEPRARYLREAYGMLRYAHRLSPQRTDVLAMLGRTADDLGQTHEALGALEECVRLLGPEKAGSEVTSRIGLIRFRLGDHDAALRWLRAAHGPLSPVTAQTLVHLANTLVDRGDTSAAIDTLANAIPTQAQPFLPQELTLVSFALAVIYDRDEQRSAAFEVLARLQATFTTSFYTSVSNALEHLRYTPAEDRYYYRALLHEAAGHYAEARAQWALYAATRGSWRDRALDHIHALDTARRRAARQPPPSSTTQSPPAGVLRRPRVRVKGPVPP